MSAHTGPTVVAIEESQQPLLGVLTSPVTRDTMQRANNAGRRLPGSSLVDISDVNYSGPTDQTRAAR